ncbi:MAG: hypothetical protein F6K31_42580 [Symploca sp. SIO2G7]|nr:hypothetical protein [Symploca sp. SIO2G7]
MEVLEFLILLAVAAICGKVGQLLAGYTAGGWLTAIVIGFIGAYLGIYVARRLSLPTFLPVQIGGQSFPIIWSVIGATVLAVIIAWIRQRR